MRHSQGSWVLTFASLCAVMGVAELCTFIIGGNLVGFRGPVKEVHGRVTGVSKRSPWWLRTRSSKRSPTRLRQSSKRSPGGYGRSYEASWVLLQFGKYGVLWNTTDFNEKRVKAQRSICIGLDGEKGPGGGDGSFGVSSC